MASGGLGLQLQERDLEHSRLVFCSLKDPSGTKSRSRKVAVSLPDNLSYADFLEQVKRKLKVAEVEEVLLATTGERLVSLDGLQDIDELLVVERPLPQSGAGGGAAVEVASAYTGGKGELLRGTAAGLAHPQAAQLRGPSAAAATAPDPPGAAGDPGGGAVDETAEQKYGKRRGFLQRWLGLSLGFGAPPGLPVSTREGRDSLGEGAGRGGGGSSGLGPQRQSQRRRRPRPQGLASPTARGLLTAAVVAAAFLVLLFLLYTFSSLHLP